MDWITQVMIGGFILLFAATIWNILTIPKQVPRIFTYFKDTYAFTTDKQNTFCKGVYSNRNIEITLNPLTINMQLLNPKNVRILIEKGIQSDIQDLTKFETKNQVSIKSNYPNIAKQLFTENLLQKLDQKDTYSFLIDDGLLLRCKQNTQTIKEFIDLGIQIIQEFEAITYASN